MRTYPNKLDEAPKKERMRDGYGYREWRMLFDWRYMRKYLKSQVGKHWNDVWSDIAATHDVRNYNEAEFRKWAKDYVYFDVYIDEDGVYQRDVGRIHTWRSPGLYVDMESGILKLLPNDRRYRRQKQESKIVRIDGGEYYKHEGIWYEVVTQPIPQAKMVNDWLSRYSMMYYGDAFGNAYYNATGIYKEPVIVKSKRQVGKRVIRRINKYLESRYYD